MMSVQKQWVLKILGVVVLVGCTVRLSPYLVSIRAADLAQDQRSLTFHDRQGGFLGTLLTRDQNHTAVITLKQVSPHFVQAIVAAEDGRFYQHGALDLWAIGRSLREAMQARRIVSGASTITMQLARMLHPLPRNLWGKTQEVWLSWRLVAGMSKDEILQAYVNRLPMGGNIYGVEAAARVYFGISASDLTVAQASLLAALPNDPTNLNPYEQWSALKRRQAYVLQQMVQDGYLTTTQADRAFKEAVSLQPRHQGIVAAPHFLFWVAQQLPPHHPSQIRTTLDLRLQQFVEAQVQQVVRSLATHRAYHAAALVIDNQTGEVLAYVGSPDYFAIAQQGRNDGIQALRQPGSTLKPFLYQLALETRAIRPNSVLADVPTHYAIPGARLYSPTDYSETFQGPVRIRVALANSLNVPTVKVLEQVGVPQFLERLHQLGFAHLTQSPDYYGLGLTLGSGEVSLWELARAYGAIVRQGHLPSLVTILPESSRPQKTVRPSQRLGTAASWALITDMLSDAHARTKAFGVESVLSLPFPAAVKTGTSSNYRDTWTVGFTTDYTVATWVGNFNGEPMQKISGVTGAAPLWQRIMLHLHEHQEPATLPTPDGLVKRPVCALSGLKPTTACPAVVQEYFYPQDLGEYEQHPDTFYQRVVDAKTAVPRYRLNLPPEYDQWLAQQPQPPLESSHLRIIFPREGDYFLLNAINSSLATKTLPQQLQFKLAGTQGQPVEWRLNGQLLATQSSPAFSWTLRPGNWTLQVRRGELTHQVNFQVRPVDQAPQRRGFSVANSKR
jgi:penicillin-binding protein 1C